MINLDLMKTKIFQDLRSSNQEPAAIKPELWSKEAILMLSVSIQKVLKLVLNLPLHLESRVADPHLEVPDTKKTIEVSCAVLNKM